MTYKDATVGYIHVFPLRERTPTTLRLHPQNDLYMVYNGTEAPHLCTWHDEAFWDVKEEVVLGVEYWFRVPYVSEFIETQVQTEGE